VKEKLERPRPALRCAVGPGCLFDGKAEGRSVSREEEQDPTRVEEKLQPLAKHESNALRKQTATGDGGISRGENRSMYVGKIWTEGYDMG
jgi:hypothetical protein